MLNDIYDILDNTIKGLGTGGTTNPPKLEDPTKNWDKTRVDVAYDEDGKPVPVPKGFTPSDTDGEKKIDTGFVIKQDGTENEFVWVPIVDGYEFGKLYDFGTAKEPKNEERESTTMGDLGPDVLVEEDSSVKGISLLKSVVGLTGTDEQILTVWEKQLKDEYSRMILSSIKYSGFYIGRYETGFEDSTKATVRKNNTPENISYQNWYQMYQKSKNLANDLDIESTMIWDCQWDATMQWFLASNDNRVAKYVRDSTGKGNHAGTQGDINIVIATGSNPDYKVNNIYDMAGNCWEWALRSGSIFANRESRGGGCSQVIGYPTSHHGFRSLTLSESSEISDRITLVI